jgi:hypothetical protein
MRRTSLALLTALLAAACTEAPDGQPATDEQVAYALAEGAGTIESVTYAGTGCPPGSTTSSFSPDKQVVTSVFSAFVAEKGPSGDPADRKLNCLVMMNIHVPAGWSYSIESLDYRGFVALESSEVKASRQSLYLMSGNPVQVAPRARFTGPMDKDYTHSDVGPTKPGVWSPCGGGQILWMATQIEVNNAARPSQAGLLTVDSLDTEIQWRRCQ